MPINEGMNTTFRILSGLLAALSLILPHADGFSEEAQWTDFIEERVEKRYLVTINGQTGSFLSIYNDATTGVLEGAVILLHGFNGYPDSPHVIRPLRTRLPHHGWGALSIPLPVYDRHAGMDEYSRLLDQTIPRIKDAINYLKSIDIHNIVLIGYDYGAIIATSYLANNNEPEIVGFIGISMPGLIHEDKRFNTSNNLENMYLPVLDIYGSHDRHDIKDLAGKRALAARLSGVKVSRSRDFNAFKNQGIAQSAMTRKSGFIAFRQFQLAGAGHTYYGFEDILVKRVAGWLKRHAGGLSLDKDQIQSGRGDAADL